MVFLKFELSSGDVIAILDSDISVDPEKLFDFFEIIDNNSADFVNGTRMIYPMEKDAMRFLNKIEIKYFNTLFLKLFFKNFQIHYVGQKFKRVNIDSLLEWSIQKLLIHLQILILFFLPHTAGSKL